MHARDPGRCTLPAAVRRRLEFFAAQFEFLEPRPSQLEYRTKDTARLAGRRPAPAVGHARPAATGSADLGAQTRNGLSVRALQTLLIYAKALAYFRGRDEVGLDDLRQVLPFVLHDKLVPDLDAPFFEADGNAAFRTDRIGWIRGCSTCRAPSTTGSTSTATTRSAQHARRVRAGPRRARPRPTSARGWRRSSGC